MTCCDCILDLFNVLQCFCNIFIFLLLMKASPLYSTGLLNNSDVMD
jgi:hypothetical protein